jgi:hypothetical protein
VSLDAEADDDFGVSSVRFYDGARLLSTQRLAPFRQTVTLPADATCDGTHTFAAIATDSAGQTRSASAAVTVKCDPTPDPPVPSAAPKGPGGPAIAWLNKPTRLSGSRTLGFAVSAPIGLKSVVVTLGLRTVCVKVSAPVLCHVSLTGSDVGHQALRAVVSDVAGGSAEISTDVDVAKFDPRALRLHVTKAAVKGGKLRRTISGRLMRPVSVTSSDACDGTVTVVLRSGGRTFLNRQLPLSKSCGFSASVTAARPGHGRPRFSITASFAGNDALTAISSSRRFL